MEKERVHVTPLTACFLWVQVKRIHEYKRQLLNVLQIIHRYSELKKMSPSDRKNMIVCFLSLTSHAVSALCLNL